MNFFNNLPAIVKLILLLSNFAVNLLLGLSKLKLGSQNLVKLTRVT